MKWCGRRDLNPHGPLSPPDFESGASASSTTPARVAETRRLLAPHSDQIECIACEWHRSSSAGISQKVRRLFSGLRLSVFRPAVLYSAAPILRHDVDSTQLHNQSR